jgi:hypothetical protein
MKMAEQTTRRWRPTLANEGAWVAVEGTLVRRHGGCAMEVDGWMQHLDCVEADFTHLLDTRRLWLLTWTGKLGIRAALDGRTGSEVAAGVAPYPSDRRLVVLH